MNRSHVIRLNPTPEQELYFRKACGVARHAYNWALSRWKDYRAAGMWAKMKELKLKQPRKDGEEGGFPRFKSKKRDRLSFYLANDKFSVDGHTIRIPKLGTVNMTEALRFHGKILSTVISYRAGWWFVSISVEVKHEVPA